MSGDSNIGKIVRWNAHKGYGFIQLDNSRTQVFAHISSFQPKPNTVLPDDDVQFQLGKDSQGRACALQVRLTKRVTKTRSNILKGPWLIFVIGYFGFVVAAYALGALHGAVVIWIALASLATLVAYWADKHAAVTGQWRTKESSLHWLSLLGGWPGALIAQKLVRHKSSKRSFQWGFWLTAILNIAGVCWMLTAEGGGFVRSFIESVSRFLF